MGQRIELAGPESTRDEHVPGPLRSRNHEGRGLDFEKIQVIEHMPHGLYRLGTGSEIRRHAIPT